jgi:hypothetical protein
MELILRCGQCNKPFDKGELCSCLVTYAESVLTAGFPRVHFEETWILLSVSKRRQDRSGPIMYLLCEAEGALR